MSRILFVDDERSVLDGLRRMLHSARKEWDMEFVASGAEALAAADAEAFDVIVTDMRMPGMDGATLLGHFAERHPETVRFVLSGHSELEAVMRTVPIAHQFLSKPCTGGTLKDHVSRALQLRELLQDGPTQNLVAGLTSLPVCPESYRAVQRALADPETDIPSVAAIIEADMAMSAKLLQLVNSAFFGLPRSMTSIAEAVSYLGVTTIRDLVLSLKVFAPPEGSSAAMQAFLARTQAQALRTGSVARRMFEDRAAASSAFTAGILHDVGLLVMATRMPERLSMVLDEAAATGRPLHLVERDLYGTTHAEIGAYLLGVWGLPYSIIEAAAFHHRPAHLDHQSFSELTAVHVASALVDARTSGDGGAPDCIAEIDLDYLEALGVGDRLPKWSALADDEASQRTHDEMRA